MVLIFTDEQLKELINGNPIGIIFPYDTKNEVEIEAHIRRLYYRIKRIPNIICEAEWDHFGSGYASFVEFFCYEMEHVKRVTTPYGIEEVEIEGVLVNISRLAPVAIFGDDERSKTIRIETGEEIGGCGGSIMGGYQLENVKDRFQPMIRHLTNALAEFNYDVLPIELLNQTLPFKAKIPTIYSEPREYSIADAIFYWED